MREFQSKTEPIELKLFLKLLQQASETDKIGCSPNMILVYVTTDNKKAHRILPYVV